MANINVAFGLKPINTAGSTPATQGTNAYFIASAQARSIRGSMVKADNGGASLSVLRPEPPKLNLVFLLAVNMYRPLQARKCFRNFWPGSGAEHKLDIIGFVYDNPMQRFIICIRRAY